MVVVKKDVTVRITFTGGNELRRNSMGKIDKIEKAQLEFLKENELTREIIHSRNWMDQENKEGVLVKVPMPIYFGDYKDESRYAIGRTLVYLLKTSEFNTLQPSERKDAIRLLKPVGHGLAVCSDLDNYNKKTGRIIATARAIRDYGERKFEEAMKHE